MLRRVDIPTSQNTVQPFTTPDTLSGSSPNFTGLSPEGQAALALARQEQDAREGLCDYPPGTPAEPQDLPRCAWCCCVPGWVAECSDCTDNHDAPTLHPTTEGLLCSACAAEAARCERCHSLTRPLVERVDSEGEVALYCEGGCEPTEETLPRDLPTADWEPWPARDPQVCDPVVAYPAGDYRIGDAEDLLGGATALRALTVCPSEISEGGTEVLLSHLELVSPGESLPALTFYLAYDSSGTRLGRPSGAAGMALSRALDELAETYSDLADLGWGEEAERQADLDAARQDLQVVRVTLSGALTPAALAALTGLDSSDTDAIPRAAALLQRLQREALPSPTPAELARLMRAACGAGRLEELAEALLAGDESRIRFLQLALLRPGAL